MCRFVAYLGPPVSLDELLLQPPHSLLRQSWAPRHQTHGVVNADGFGVGWYDRAVRPEPARYRSARPMWADRNLPSLAPLTRSTAVLAAVRSATPPLPVEETNSPPFADGPWLFAHNGAADVSALRRTVSDRRLAGLQGTTDSEVLFALALDRLDQGASPADALRSVVDIANGRLNLVLTDGVVVVATACGNSLFVRSGRGVVVASEPFDDEPGWEPVPDRSLVEATAESVRTAPL
jgi:glutamine amidotransferase